MEALSAQQREKGVPYKDPYYEVIQKPEHNGRLHLYRKGVTKSVLRKKENISNFVLAQEFLHGIKKDWVEEVQQLNPGMNLILPDSFLGQVSTNASTAKSGVVGPYVANDSTNQVICPILFS